MQTAQKEAKKKGVEDNIRDHLRGFSRTIPPFLMAYGDDDTTLANFDTKIPADVFKDVTSITVEQFRFLRDGGDVVNDEGETVHFDGHLFEPVVFDDSVKEFMRLRIELADYFDESQKRDIFDYVPPQKTNQIYTPKKVVKQMVDLFEQENPGCLDDPSNTFADLYMKSGLFIAEIVKRLFNSEGMRRAFPDENARLAHIFADQVFGVAPTEIIFNIAINFIFGFRAEHGDLFEASFVMADTAELAKEGKLAEFVTNSSSTSYITVAFEKVDGESFSLEWVEGEDFRFCDCGKVIEYGDPGYQKLWDSYERFQWVGNPWNVNIPCDGAKLFKELGIPDCIKHSDFGKALMEAKKEDLVSLSTSFESSGDYSFDSGTACFDLITGEVLFGFAPGFGNAARKEFLDELTYKLGMPRAIPVGKAKVGDKLMVRADRGLLALYNSEGKKVCSIARTKTLANEINALPDGCRRSIVAKVGGSQKNPL